MSLDDVPLETLFDIAANMTSAEVGTLCRTSSLFNEALCRNEYFWRQRYLQRLASMPRADKRYREILLRQERTANIVDLVLTEGLDKLLTNQKFITQATYVREQLLVDKLVHHMFMATSNMVIIEWLLNRLPTPRLLSVLENGAYKAYQVFSAPVIDVFAPLVTEGQPQLQEHLALSRIIRADDVTAFDVYFNTFQGKSRLYLMVVHGDALQIFNTYYSDAKFPRVIAFVFRAARIYATLSLNPITTDNYEEYIHDEYIQAASSYIHFIDSNNNNNVDRLGYAIFKEMDSAVYPMVLTSLRDTKNYQVKHLLAKIVYPYIAKYLPLQLVMDNIHSTSENTTQKLFGVTYDKLAQPGLRRLVVAYAQQYPFNYISSRASDVYMYVLLQCMIKNIVMTSEFISVPVHHGSNIIYGQDIDVSYSTPGKIIIKTGNSLYLLQFTTNVTINLGNLKYVTDHLYIRPNKSVVVPTDYQGTVYLYRLGVYDNKIVDDRKYLV